MDLRHFKEWKSRNIARRMLRYLLFRAVILSEARTLREAKNLQWHSGGDRQW
jgi:hypothetical protein